MPKFDSLVSEDLSDEEPAMAVLRVSLAAEQRDPVALRTSREPLERVRKRLLFGHRPVEGVTVRVVVLLLCRAAAELVSKKQIADAPPTHGRLDLVAVEMWRETRVRERPHIHEELDLLTRHKLRKVIKPVI
jgi:hypothetical protein